MDILGLTDNEVSTLIESIKFCQKSIPGEMPLIGKIKDDTPVTDFKHHIQYELHRYRNPVDSKRFSLHIRFKQTNDHLIRMDINNGTHRNPDGQTIPQNHMHIYHNTEDLAKDSIAIPLPDDITDISSLFSALENFLMYAHTTNKKV